jgi:hypothetical protein
MERKRAIRSRLSAITTDKEAVKIIQFVTGDERLIALFSGPSRGHPNNLGSAVQEQMTLG